MKKDVLIILRHEPLLFVKTPPVYTKITIKDEESTSVFSLSDHVQEPPLEEKRKIVHEVKSEEKKQEKEETTLKNNEIKPDMLRKIETLSTPFSRQVYRPLEFILGDEKLTGIIEKVEEDTLFVLLVNGEKQDPVVIDIGEIEQILWRGAPFEGD